ncbi:hypothetical protein [Bradyrhizobium sp. 33ap4]|uniref:hypothetical protein n=1 Tax=Bradyrhizobium sp. 33ap4 TaxID=3061630 RepID=UPI002930C648|nr:hypothetical protein [Bradyrhizobium sp. 33ap4]
MLSSLGFFQPARSLLERILDVTSTPLLQAARLKTLSLSLTALPPSQVKAFSATLARVTGADAPCSIQIVGVNFDLVPKLLWGTKMTLSVRFATLARNFFEIVNSDQRMFTESVVHNLHAVSSVRRLHQREVVEVFALAALR